MYYHKKKKNLNTSFDHFLYSMENNLDFSELEEVMFPPTELIIRPRRSSNTYVRIANFSPDLPLFTAYIDENILGEDLAYSDRSPYLRQDPGEYTIRLFASEEDEMPFYEETLILPARTIITMSVVSVNGNIGIQLTNDSIRIPANRTVVKFVNYALDSPSLNLEIDDVLYYENIAYLQSTDYTLLLDNVDFNIRIRDAQSGEILIDGRNVVLMPNKAYTFYAIGVYDSSPPMQVVTTLDGSSYLLE
jgi:hypothetical protein